MELEDWILAIGRVGGNYNYGVGGMTSLEELFNAAVLDGGEGGELGVVGGELGKDFFFIGGSHCDVVEVAVELIQHGVLISNGCQSERRHLGGRDAIDGSYRVGGAKEMTSSVGSLLLAFGGELGGTEGFFYDIQSVAVVTMPS